MQKTERRPPSGRVSLASVPKGRVLMMFRKSYLLSYLPGLAILVISMFALHSSLLFIEEYNEFMAQQQHRAILGLDISSPGTMSETLRMTEDRLYWSILALGLAGFILVLLNSDQVRKLSDADETQRESLMLLEHRLAAMEASFDGIGIIDSKGVLTYMNRAFMDIYGINPDKSEEFKGKEWQLLYDEKGQAEIKNVIMPELAETGHWHGVSSVARQDGDTVNTELSLTRLPDGGVIGTIRDITGKLAAEQEKEELQEQFFQAQKMEAIGRLAGGIAHDFNNILAAMNGNAEFLIEDLDEDTPQHAFARNILKAGTQARKLVDQMLAFSRRKDSDLAQVDLNESVQEALTMLEVSMPKMIELQTDIDVSSAVINGNQTQISQVIMNLCVNAQDAMEDEKGVLEIGLKDGNVSEFEVFDFVEEEALEEDEVPVTRFEDVSAGRTRLFLGHLARHQDYIILSVRDEGCGMSRVVMEQVFEPFFTTKPVDKGTGLGLATVHGVIAGHQGALIIDSKIGEGTKFQLFFPVAQEAAAVQSYTDEEHVSGMSQQIHVHLVEDQEEVRETTIAMLERYGCDVTASTGGLEALEYLREAGSDVDLVITDHNMPKMSGLEMIYQVHMTYPEMPFILLSGYSEKKLQDLMKEHPGH